MPDQISQVSYFLPNLSHFQVLFTLHAGVATEHNSFIHSFIQAGAHPSCLLAKARVHNAQVPDSIHYPNISVHLQRTTLRKTCSFMLHCTIHVFVEDNNKEGRKEGMNTCVRVLPSTLERCISDITKDFHNCQFVQIGRWTCLISGSSPLENIGCVNLAQHGAFRRRCVCHKECVFLHMGVCVCVITSERGTGRKKQRTSLQPEVAGLRQL